jgi:hypothetical protein
MSSVRADWVLTKAATAEALVDREVFSSRSI